MTQTTRYCHLPIAKLHNLASRMLVVSLAWALITLFGAARLPVWHGNFIPYYSPDSAIYFLLSYDIANGHLPTFSVRTPGYPIFLVFILGLGNRITLIIIFQQLATLASGLALYMAFVKTRRWLAIPGGIAVAGYFLSGDTIIYETLLGPESLYTSTLVTTIACLSFGATAKGSTALAAASVLMGLAIWLKPAALFFVVVFFAVIALLWLLGYARRCIVAFSLPFPILLSVLATYNLATMGQFTLSPWGSANLIAATSTFWRDSPSYPEEMRSAIQEMHSLLTPNDRVMLLKSWDPNKLFPIYDRYYNLSVHKVLRQRLAGYGNIIGHMPVDPGDAKLNRLLKRVSLDAILSNPLQYLKFVYTNAYYFFWIGPQKYYSYQFSIEDRYLQVFGPVIWAPSLSDTGFRRYALREFEKPSPLESFSVIQEMDRFIVTVKSTRALRFHELLSIRFFSRAYDGRIWFLVFSAATLMLAVAVTSPRMRAAAPNCILTASASALTLLGAGLLVALVELSLDRYSSPTRFTYFLSLPFGIWLFVEWFRGRK